MSSDEAVGRWYCELVDQEQSDDEAEQFGDYDDFDRPPQKAAKTEFAETTLELAPDGSYRLQGPDWAGSHGTWSRTDARFTLTEAEDSSNGFDGLEYASQRGGRLVVGFKLVPDAHDGLDVLVLTFGRTPPAAKGQKPEGFVEQLIAVEDEDELYELLDAFEGDPDQVEGELWDAWIGGRFLNDPESERYDLHLQILEQDRFREAGGFTHAHAKHGLTTLDYDVQRQLCDAILDKIATLPVDEQADAELAPLLTGPWFERLVTHRFLGGGLPEELYARRLVPQPAVDDACRAYLARNIFTRFEALERLFPPGHADFAKVAIRYRGRGMLEIPLAQIEARGVADEALAAALELLASPDAVRWQEACLNGILFATVLSIRGNQPLPAIVLEHLANERKAGMVRGGLSEDERTQLRELIVALPEDQRELLSKRFRLDGN